jgi:hypothetical protein
VSPGAVLDPVVKRKISSPRRESNPRTPIVGPKRKKVAAGWRRLHNEELHNLYPSRSISRVVKSRNLLLAVFVERMEELSDAYILIGDT